MITCPICNKIIKKVYQHLNQTEVKHKELLLEQEQLVLKSFEDYNFNKNNISEYGILFDYTTCLRIYSENVDEETRKIRANKARSIKSSKGLKKYHATKKLDKTYCPICRKKSKRIYSHLIYTLSDNTNDLYKEHYNFFKNQLKIIYDLFFDFNFDKTKDKNYNQHLYFGYSACYNFWREIFSKEELDLRNKLMTSYNISKSLTGRKITEKTRQKLITSHMGQQAWNKGLTAKDNPNMLFTEEQKKCLSEAIKEGYKNGTRIAWKTGLTKETDERINLVAQKVSKTMVEKEPKHSRGLIGIRKDLGFNCYSSWEANIYRIFQYHGYKDGIDYKREFENIFPIQLNNGIWYYRIDIQDIVGLFGIKNAYIEVKGLMDNDDRAKIEGFKQQYKEHTLLVIGNHHKNPLYDYEYDVIYNKLEEKYKPLIPLWETTEQNLRNRPDLYAVE